MKVRIVISLFLVIAIASQAQDKTAMQFAEHLDSARMKTTLTRLASVEFAGRKSGEKGAVLAAEYLTYQLKQNNIKEGNKGSYKQGIEAFHREKHDKYFTLGDFNFADCYSYSNNTFQDSVIAGSDIVFAGFGLYHSTFNDFGSIDIKDKIVMILDGDGPINKYGVRCHNASDIPNMKYMAAQKPKAILMVKQGFNTFSNYPSKRLVFFSTRESQPLTKVQINELLANRILEPVNKSIKQLQFESESSCSASSFEFRNELAFNGDNAYQLADVNNIVGIIEGTDMKNEYVILTAHYDHIGSNSRKEIFFGADDNASGVSAVLEIARVLNEAKKAGKGPRRSVVILFPAAEEDGLCGSEYYVEKPVFPLEHTIVCVNIDMLGRTDSKTEDEDMAKNYVYALTGTRKKNGALFGIPDSINTIATKLSILSSEGSSYGGFFSRSDHYSFFKKEIPSIIFTNGSHDDLHKTTDVAEKIDYGAMLKRSKLVFLTVWELANNPDPFKQPRADADVLQMESSD